MFLSAPPPLSPSPRAAVAGNLSDQKSTRTAQESFPHCLWLKILLPSLAWKQFQAFGQHHYMTAATSFWEVLPFNHHHFLINITQKISQHKRNHLLERLAGRAKELCTGTTQHQRRAWERIQQAALQLNKECVFTPPDLLGPGLQQWDTGRFGSSQTNTSTERGRERARCDGRGLLFMSRSGHQQPLLELDMALQIPQI